MGAACNWFWGRKTKTKQHTRDMKVKTAVLRADITSVLKKVKQSRYTPWRRLGGERRYSSYSFWTSALDGGEWSASRPGRAFTPGESTPGTHSTGGWVGLRAGLDTEVRGKILCPRRGSNPDRPVFQPVVRHYTDWATPAPCLYGSGMQMQWVWNHNQSQATELS
jgi:hypothetical protein